ncbi:hypothetical protein L6452_18168 [Arctium lappa]|uniref:Uncharacterized protein n=1 Tax=Arctium lappa TaxID=4217 RepID=A0ACB9C5K3_ARCLA|nr:hypothetical protein L6452_18168 [Arctium lappa]
MADAVSTIDVRVDIEEFHGLNYFKLRKEKEKKRIERCLEKPLKVIRIPRNLLGSLFQERKKERDFKLSCMGKLLKKGAVDMDHARIRTRSELGRSEPSSVTYDP